MRDNAWLNVGSNFPQEPLESSLNDLELVYDQAKWHRIHHAGFVLDFFAYIKADSDKIVL